MGCAGPSGQAVPWPGAAARRPSPSPPAEVTQIAYDQGEMMPLSCGAQMQGGSTARATGLPEWGEKPRALALRMKTRWLVRAKPSHIVGARGGVRHGGSRASKLKLKSKSTDRSPRRGSGAPLSERRPDLPGRPRTRPAECALLSPRRRRPTMRRASMARASAPTWTPCWGRPWRAALFGMVNRMAIGRAEKVRFKGKRGLRHR